MGRTWLWNGTAWQASPMGLGWSDIKGKPTSFSPSAHAATHATGGADAISPASIGAATAAQGTKADNAATITDAIVNALIFG